MKVEVYSDIVCPWCYVGERRFGRPAGDMLSHVTENAAGEGITIDWDAAIAANTRNAHRLLGFAEREYGAAMQRKLVDALFDAHFSQGANVADIDTLSDLAEAAGIDRARAHAYLASNEGTAELDRAFREARELGVTSVPTFVFDELHAVQGAQPADTFVQVLNEVKSRSSASVKK